jgi:NDP-sugar pyrophosphorylase family protein
MTARKHISGIVLVGTHPWTNSAFDRLAPRPLLPIANRPLVWYALSWMADASVHNVAVCANRETQVLEARLHGSVPAGMTVSYHEEAMPRGPAGAVRDAAANSNAAVFVVAEGTAIPHVDLAELLRAHEASGAIATVVVHKQASRYDRQTVQVPSGIYVFDRHIIDFVPANGFFDIKENLIPQLHKAGQAVAAYCVDSVSPRVLDASSYLAVNEWMIEHLAAAAAPPEEYRKSQGALFHRDAIVAPDAVIVGPVLVGPGAHVMSGAVIVGPTSIGREAVIGEGVLVSRSAIWRRAVVQDGVVADRCIVGDDAVVLAGTHAFREIRSVRSKLQAPPERPMPQPADTSTELLRRVSRAVVGASLSRSPAAQ